MQLICAKCANTITDNFADPVELGEELKKITCPKCKNEEFLVTYIDEDSGKIWAMPTNETPRLDWLTISDVAKVVGLSPYTVRNHIFIRKKFTFEEIKGYIRRSATGIVLVHKSAVRRVYGIDPDQPEGEKSEKIEI